jgi:hypothetical protein
MRGPVNPARARELFAVPATDAPNEEQRQQVRKQLLDEAAEPLASNPPLCEALLRIRQAQEITVDVLTADKLTFAGARPDQNLNYETAAGHLTSEFEAYCRENGLWHDPNEQPTYSQIVCLQRGPIGVYHAQFEKRSRRGGRAGHDVFPVGYRAGFIDGGTVGGSNWLSRDFLFWRGGCFDNNIGCGDF